MHFGDKHCHDHDDDDADRSDVVQDFVARLRNPTLVVLEWTPPQRPGIIKYRVYAFAIMVTISQRYQCLLLSAVCIASTATNHSALSSDEVRSGDVK